MKYKDYERNHVIFPGREQALYDFLKADYKGMKHKWKNGFSSNSEDALTWSCFDTITNLPVPQKLTALDVLFEEVASDHFDSALIAIVEEYDLEVSET